MSTPINVGDVFGQLTIIKSLGAIKHRRTFVCRCSCGKEITTLGQSLVGKGYKTVSCGCKKAKNLLQVVTHNLSYSGFYAIWHGMLARCEDTTNKRYKDYGGRGIKVCERWHDLINFYNDMKPRPQGYTIDRIDNNGDYTPGNCKWSTRSEQQQNRRNNHMITFNNKTMCIKKWADELNVSFTFLATRLRRGWSIERALTEKKHRKSRND